MAGLSIPRRVFQMRNTSGNTPPSELPIDGKFATMIMFYFSTCNDAQEASIPGREPDAPRHVSAGASTVDIPVATGGLLVAPVRALRHGDVEIANVIVNNTMSGARPKTVCALSCGDCGILEAC